METSVIRIDRLSKRYGSVIALDGLSLVVPRGAIFGFLGPNGAGKTTTIDLLLGLTEPSAGRATVLGFDTVEAPGEIRTRVGALLDETGLYDQLSAYENLDFNARIWRMSRDRADSRIRELLDDIQLWDRRDDPVGSWSKGMRQRLAIARAQLHEPELLFLDEPTAGLDVVSARDVRDQLSQLADRGTTIFLTTHNMAEAEELCARVAIINHGRLIASGLPSELLSGSGSPLTIEGEHLDRAAHAIRDRPDVMSCVVDGSRMRLMMAGSDPSQVIAQVIAAGSSIHEVRRGTHLEDAFLQLVREES